MATSRPVAHAITRGIPDTLADAVVLAAPSAPIRVEIARRQHQAYVDTLRSLGIAVTVLPADNAFPDCCFVEDCAVHADGVALITRPGAPSRRGEEIAVAEALRPLARLEWMAAPATLDGGDCLRIGKRMYVGRSARTNAAGIACLRNVFGPLGFEVIEISVGGLLHLKCACSSVHAGSILLAEGNLPIEPFRDLQVIHIPANEAYAANCVAVNGTVLMADGFPGARRAVKSLGLTILELDMSEIRKADGSMTCLSILV